MTMPTNFSTKESLETVWGVLHQYREDLIPEGDEAYDNEWGDVCTAMAWITDALGAEDNDGPEVEYIDAPCVFEVSKPLFDAVALLSECVPAGDSHSFTYSELEKAIEHLVRSNRSSWAGHLDGITSVVQAAMPNDYPYSKIQLSVELPSA